MSDEKDLSVEERIYRLLKHLGIDRAHFAGHYRSKRKGSDSREPRRIQPLSVRLDY